MSKQQEEDSTDPESDLPIWARKSAFPTADQGYGWCNRKGVKHPCASLDELSQEIREDKESAIHLVWTPDSEFCRVPEEVEAFTESISVVRKRWAVDDLADANHRLKWFGFCLLGLLCYMAFMGSRQMDALENSSGLVASPMEKIQWIFKIFTSSTTVGISLLGFLVFAFIPWYQAQKRVREMKRPAGLNAPLVPLLRFETWLQDQKSPVTWGILGMIVVVFLAQFFSGNAVEAAGLVKSEYLAGERWRLLTAPMMHGGILHLAMNGMGLLYLGKRVEVFARWPHVPMVFLFTALVGGEASARFVDANSVGASGGLMGLLGFLLVFETLHSKLVPRSARRRLIGGVVMTGLIGLVGYRFIDNAAHLGGLLAGMAYAVIVFPKSGSVLRPRVTLTDRLVGGASLGVIAGSAIYAIIRMSA
ncbi:rhomboid family intramembrane serine protease [Luteolibacter sp. AS25]|uniref:rhomboid family intramembrane serine protease n=1 Tax=Luteolibacter sp. AS25 TaxID=3135776 RepID=UPI00398B78A6